QGVTRAGRQIDLDVARHHQRAEALVQAARRQGDFALGARALQRWRGRTHGFLQRALSLASPPSTPLGRKITTITSSTPIQKYQYCGVVPENWSRATMKMRAPPSTSMTRSSAERSNDSESSETVSVVCASSAPAMPAIAAEIV